MSDRSSTPRAWLELMRLSNAPTIVSNVLAGGAIAAGDGAMWSPALAPAAASMLMLYVAGMILNDVCDAEVDRLERPGRPIPSGRIGLGAARGAGAGLIAAAVVIVALACPSASIATMALVICIAAYNLLHRRTAWSVLLLGGCRGLVYVVAAQAAAGEASPNARLLGACAAFMAAYVVALSLLARAEAGARARIRLVVAMICAISLIDAGLLVILHQPLAAGAAAGCFIACAFAQRRIIGT